MTRHEGRGPRPAVLHFAFEDHRAPASGGGSRRTREINRRLAGRFDITVVAAAYPGARRRTEDGVTYRHLGLRSRHRFVSIMSYHLCVPFAAWRSRADVIIEDFASPLSSMAVRVWTRRPVVAVVQWLFARETSRQYRLPFFVFESLGVRTHRRFVAVSEVIAAQLRRRNADAEITVIPNGLDAEALTGIEYPVHGRRLVFLGRYQWSAKGLDALFDAFARIAAQDRTVELHCYGGGPDEAQVRRHAASHPAADRLHVHGWIDGADKYAVLARAHAVVVPSRYESFGLVALEAMAVGAPVIGFDIPALRELVGSDCGHLARSFDVESLADAVLAVLGDDALRSTLGRAGRARSLNYDWDSVAARHGDVIDAALAARPVVQPVPVLTEAAT